MSSAARASVAPSGWTVEGIHLLDTASEADISERRGDATLRPEVPILCLHGIGSSSQAFTAQMADLAGDHRLVAWDAPGYGQSADPDDPLDLDGYVERILLVIDRLGGCVHLLGVSFGGVLALATALSDPSRVASAILVGASPGSGRSEAAAAALLGRVDQLERLGPAAFAKQRAPSLLSPGAPTELVRLVASTMAGAVRLPGYRWAAHTMAATDLTSRLGDVTVPTMVLFGEDDQVTGRAAGEVLAHAIPGAVSVSIMLAGHLVNQEQPAAVNAWIAAFVQIVERLPTASPLLLLHSPGLVESGLPRSGPIWSDSLPSRR